MPAAERADPAAGRTVARRRRARREAGGAVALGLALAIATTTAGSGSEAPAPPPATAPVAAEAERFWPQWRGPLATGEAPHADPPVAWSEAENVRFKVPIPGLGHSTPIVWGDRIYLTTAVPAGDPVAAARRPGAHDNLAAAARHRFVVLALDRADGRVAWERTVREAAPHEGGHVTASYASPSPAADGERLVASFGSRGIYALDLAGRLLWQVDLGEMETKHGHGEGSSPVLAGGIVAVNWDHEGGSFVAAFDAASGRELWRAERDEPTSWATPIVVEDGGRPQLVVSGTGRVRGYDLATGRVVWKAGGLSANVVASPVAGDGLVFAGSSYDTRALLAIRFAGARGELSGGDRIAWRRDRATPYVPSPLLYRGALYYLAHYQGILSRVDAATGRDRPGAMRLPGIGNVYASPVAAAGRVYVTDRDGTTLVLDASEEPRVLAANRLDDRFSASAAIAGRELYLRGERFLYAVAEP